LRWWSATPNKYQTTSSNGEEVDNHFMNMVEIDRLTTHKRVVNHQKVVAQCSRDFGSGAFGWPTYPLKVRA
jgi:hypothetical protein